MQVTVQHTIIYYGCERLLPLPFQAPPFAVVVKRRIHNDKAHERGLAYLQVVACSPTNNTAFKVDAETQSVENSGYIIVLGQVRATFQGDVVVRVAVVYVNFFKRVLSV